MVIKFHMILWLGFAGNCEINLPNYYKSWEHTTIIVPDKMLRVAIPSFVIIWIITSVIWNRFLTKTYVILCAIWCHLRSLKNVKNTHGWVKLLLKLQTEICNFTESINVPWVFFKLYKWYQITQSVTYVT